MLPHSLGLASSQAAGQLGAWGKAVGVGSMVTLRRECPLCSSAYRHLICIQTGLICICSVGAHSSVSAWTLPPQAYHSCRGRGPSHPLCPRLCLGLCFPLWLLLWLLPTCRHQGLLPVPVLTLVFFPPPHACPGSFSRSLPSKPGARPLVEAEGWPQLGAGCLSVPRALNTWRLRKP